MTVSEEEARALLDEVAEGLIARGYREAVTFGVQGRRPGRPFSSALHFIGFEDGQFRCWYRESSEPDVLIESEDFVAVRDVFVKAVEDEDRAYRAQLGEKP